jgi:Holliday junction resolvase-like predicted endonuclease
MTSKRSGADHGVPDSRSAADVRRRHTLGKKGEDLAWPLLKKGGFRLPEPALPRNHRWGDVLAERGGRLYLISVKMRNKMERSGDPNHWYKLGAASTCLQDARKEEAEHKAKAAWLAISLDRGTYDAYFGTLDDLMANPPPKGRAGTGIPMGPESTKHYECLAENEPHSLNYEYLSNLP